jgi:hypothetical protein
VLNYRIEPGVHFTYWIESGLCQLCPSLRQGMYPLQLYLI